MMRRTTVARGNPIFHLHDISVGNRWVNAKKRLNKTNNMGALTAGDYGDQFTNPNVYTNEGNAPLATKYTRKVRKLYESDVKNMLAADVPDDENRSRDRRLIEVSKHGRRPENSAEKRFARAIDEEDLQLGAVASKRSLYKKAWHKNGLLQQLSSETRSKNNTTDNTDEDVDKKEGGEETSERKHKMYNFGKGLSGAGSSSMDGQYTDKMHRAFNGYTPDEQRQYYLASKDIVPTEKETKDLIAKLARLNENGDEVRREDRSGTVHVTQFSAARNPDNLAEGVRQRLVEEYAVYPTQRIDAFMLGDDSIFPPWIHELAPAIRDRVKYGGMGITEEDEALRIRLARMPIDARQEEWARLKAAKSYEAGLGEQKINPRDIREARLVKRNNMNLERKRLYRANILRRLALKKPEEYAIHPSQRVDFSVRLAAIAQCVENGVDTKGKWPINQEELHRAKVRNLQDHAERTFLKTTDERRVLNRQRDNGMNSEIAETLRQLDHKVAPETAGKRISRRGYGIRVNNVKMGVMDHKGRHLGKLYSRAGTRTHIQTVEESRARKEQYAAPSGIYITNPHKSREQNYMSGWQTRTSPGANFQTAMPDGTKV